MKFLTISKDERHMNIRNGHYCLDRIQRIEEARVLIESMVSADPNGRFVSWICFCAKCNVMKFLVQKSTTTKNVRHRFSLLSILQQKYTRTELFCLFCSSYQTDSQWNPCSSILLAWQEKAWIFQDKIDHLSDFDEPRITLDTNHKKLLVIGH